MGTDEIPEDVRKLLEEARRNTGPRKHHLVPSSYLDRWAVDGKIRVRQLEHSKSHLARPHKAARETDYYRAESEDLDPDLVPPMIFETILSRIEGPAVAAIDHLIEMPDEVDLQARYDLAAFMAFQHTRGHRQRLRIRATANEIFKLQTRDMSNEHIRRVLSRDSGNVTPQEIEKARSLIDKLQKGDVFVEPQDVQATSLAFTGAQLSARLLFERPWVIAATSSNLITTDEPILPIAGPGAPRTETSGVGVAGVVVFPLSPDRVLLALRRDAAFLLGHRYDLRALGKLHLDLNETIALSRELVMSATRWAFERSDRKILDNLVIPPRHEDISIDEFPGQHPDSSIVRHFSHTRWANAEFVPDWPLQGLWPAGWQSLPIPRALGDQIEEYRREEEERIRRDNAS